MKKSWQRNADAASKDATAEYLEEVPLDLVPQFVEGREYVVLTMEYGQVSARPLATVDCSLRYVVPS